MPVSPRIPVVPRLPRTVLRAADRAPALAEGHLALESAARHLRLWTAFRRGTLTEAQGRQLLDQVRLDAMRQTRSISASLLRHDITPDAWQRSMRDALVAKHYAAAFASNGSFNLSDSDLRDVQTSIRTQLGYLARFRKDIRSGDQPLDGRLLTRADLYGAAVWSTSQGLRASQATRQGYTQERAIRAANDSCETCLDRTKGKRVGSWRKIGSLVPIGAGICRSRCRCRFEYKKKLR